MFVCLFVCYSCVVDYRGINCCFVESDTIAAQEKRLGVNDSLYISELNSVPILITEDFNMQIIIHSYAV